MDMPNRYDHYDHRLHFCNAQILHVRIALSRKKGRELHLQMLQRESLDSGMPLEKSAKKSCHEIKRDSSKNKKEVTMNEKKCCPSAAEAGASKEYETAHIEKAKNSCSLCENYAERNKDKPIVIMSCEGACLRGEVARQAANILCHALVPERTVRICLGGAFTKDTGQRDLVRKTKRLIALEGCPVNCSSRMMTGVIDGLKPEVIIADRLYEFDRRKFGVEEMPAEQILAHARVVAQKVAETL